MPLAKYIQAKISPNQPIAIQSWEWIAPCLLHIGENNEE